MGDLNTVLGNVKQTAQVQAPSAPEDAEQQLPDEAPETSPIKPDSPELTNVLKGVQQQADGTTPTAEQDSPEEAELLRSVQQKRQSAAEANNGFNMFKNIYRQTATDRIASAFGHGTEEAGNAALMTPSLMTDEEMEKAAPIKGENAWQDNINKYVVRPILSEASVVGHFGEVAMGVASAPFEGLAQALEQTGKETGSQVPSDAANLLRDPAVMMILHQVAVPNASSMQDALMKPQLPKEVYRAVDNGIIEPNDPTIKEEAYQYTQTDAVALQVDQEGLRTPAQEPITPEAPTVHGVARADNPQLFGEYDPLSTRRDFYDKTFSELLEKRRDQAEQDAPHNDAIADLEDKMEDANPRKAKIYQDRIDALKEKNQDYVDEQMKPTNFDDDLKNVREKLSQASIRLGQMEPDVQQALRAAQEKVPVPEEAPEPGFQPTEGHYGEFQENGQAAPPVEETPPAVTDKIADTISKSLQDAGRPKGEADASAQIAASFYKTLADVYGSGRGTAEDWFARTGAAVTQGGEGKTIRGAYKTATDTAKATIRLLKSANESTFIHESGHHFLTVMDSLAKEADAPERIKGDVSAIRKWLGVGDDVDIFEKNAKGKYIYEKQHEQFAKGFENYMREGVAPSKSLAGVFARFKTWMENIYKTAQRLKTPLSAEVRGVFDRMLAVNPERTVIADDTGKKSITDVHEAEAANTPPEKAAEVRDAIRSDIDDVLKNHNTEIYDAVKAAETEVRTRGVASETTGDTAGAQEQSVAAGKAATEEPAQVSAGGDQPVAEGGSERGGIDATGERGPDGKPVKEKSVPADKLFDGEPKAGNLRLDNLTNDKDIRSALRMMAEKTKLLDHEVVSDVQVAEFARALGKKGSDTILEKLSHMAAEDGVPLAAYVRAAVEMLGRAEDDARALAAKVENGTEADFQNALEGQDRFMMVAATVSETGNELGRAMRAFQETSAVRGSALELQELFQRVGSSREERKQLFKLIADKPKGKGAKVMQEAAKPGFWGTFSEYRRCAILSGWVTHSLWLAGTGVNLTYKAVVLDTLGGLHNEIGKLMGRPDTGSRVFGGMEGLIRTVTKALPNILSATGTAATTGKTVLRPFEGKHDTFLATGGIGKTLNVDKVALAKAVEDSFNADDHDDLKALREKVENANAQGNTDRAAVLQESLDKKTEKRKAELTQTIASAMQNKLKTWGNLATEMHGFATSVLSGIEAVGKNLVSPEYYKNKPFLGFDREEGAIPNVSVKGIPVLPLGSVMRGTSNRIYSTMHTFCREIAANIETVQEARRVAVEEGNKGADIETRKNDLLENPTKEFMQRVNLLANKQTLMSNESSFAKVITNFRNKLDAWSGTKAGSILFPVVGVPAEATAQAVVDSSPLGLLSAKKRSALMGEIKIGAADALNPEAQKAAEAKAALEQERAQVKMIAGTSLIGLGFWLGENQMATPSPPVNYKQDEERRDAGLQSGSVRLGDWMVNLQHLPVTGTVLTLGADLNHIMHVAMGQDDSDRIKPAITSAINSFFLHENALVGLSDIVDAMRLKVDPMTYLKNQGESLYPQFIKQTNDIIDPVQRDSKSFLAGIVAKTPYLSQDAPAKINALTGEPLPREPLHINTAIGDPIAQNLMSLHIYPSSPKATINGTDLSPQQTAEYGSIKGHILYNGLQMLMQGEGADDYKEADTDGKRKMIQRIQTHASNCAKSMMFTKYPELLKDANDKYEAQCLQDVQ